MPRAGLGARGLPSPSALPPAPSPLPPRRFGTPGAPRWASALRGLPAPCPPAARPLARLRVPSPLFSLPLTGGCSVACVGVGSPGPAVSLLCRPFFFIYFFSAPSVGGVESAQPTRGVTAVPRGPGLPPTSPPSPLNLLLQRWGLRRESLSVVPPPRSAGGVINHDIYFLQRRKPGRGDFEGRKSLGTLPPTRCFSSAPSPPVGGSEGRSAPPVPALPSRGGWCHRVGRGGSGRRDPAWGCALSVCGGAGTEGSPLGNGGKLVCGGIVIATTIKKSPQNLSAIPPLPPFLYFILLCFFSSR